MPQATTQKTDNVARVFRISVILKGINAIFEIMSAFAILVVSQVSVMRLVALLTHEELIEDPRDRIASYLIASAQHLSLGTREFIFVYLLSHGLIKIVLVINLLRNKLWAYPASLVVFSLFIVYQLYRFTHTHSLSLLVLTIFDLVVIGLVWREYRALKLKT